MTFPVRTLEVSYDIREVLNLLVEYRRDGFVRRVAGSSGISTAPGSFVVVLTNAPDTDNGDGPTLSLWAQTTPTVNTMSITVCSDPSEPWQAFTGGDLPCPVGLHHSAKWRGKSSLDGLWLGYYDRFQMDVSTLGV